MMLPENFERLVTPNTSKDLEDLAAELSDLRGETEEGVKNRLLDRNYMSDLRHTFITAKRWVGRAAVNITSHSLFQKELIYVKDARFRIALPHNSVIVDGTPFVSLSGTLDRAGKYISDKLSMYANSFVDVVKDPYIMKIIYSDRLVSTFMFLERAGVPMRSIGLFMTQPIIREYVNMLDASGESSFSIENERAITALGKMFPTTKDALNRASIDVSDKGMSGAISKYYKDNKFHSVKVADKPIEFLNIAIDCLLFIGAGGSMTRELAVLGVPTISVYQEKLLDVDRVLIANGLMIHEPDLTADKLKVFIQTVKINKMPNNFIQKGKSAYSLIKNSILNYKND
jgi:hypothetical protein